MSSRSGCAWSWTFPGDGVWGDEANPGDPACGGSGRCFASSGWRRRRRRGRPTRTVWAVTRTRGWSKRSGARRSPSTRDEAVLKASVHGRLACTACHAGIKEVPHAEKVPPVSCSGCHGPASGKFAQSVHGRKDGPQLDCQTCHGAHVVKPAAQLGTAVCETCHQPMVQGWQASVHGKAVAQGVKEAAQCRDCHGATHELLSQQDPGAPTSRAKMAETCARCHADRALIEKRQIPVPQAFQLYQKSVHGRAVAAGKPAATCNNCHASHQILRANDPKSTVYRENIPQMCGSCHSRGDQGLPGKHSRHRHAPRCHQVSGLHRLPRGALHHRGAGPELPGQRRPGDQDLRELPPGAGDHREVRPAGKPGGDVPGQLPRAGGARGEPHGGQLLELPRLSRRPPIHGSQILDPRGQPPGHLREMPSGRERELREGQRPRLRHTPGRADPLLRPRVLPVDDPGHDRRHGRAQRPGLPEEDAAGVPPPGRRQGARSPPTRTPPTPRSHRGSISACRPSSAGSTSSWRRASSSWSIPASPSSSRRAGRSPGWWPWRQGYAWRGWVHRGAALVMLLACLLHVVYLPTRRGRAHRPGHAAAALRREGGHSERRVPARRCGAERPRFDRFSYIEKAEYWALIWGSVVMAVTGFVLWFETDALRVPAAVGAGSGDADPLLRGLAGHAWPSCVWHFYFVIFNPDVYPMNWTVADREDLGGDAAPRASAGVRAAARGGGAGRRTRTSPRRPPATEPPAGG